MKSFFAEIPGKSFPEKIAAATGLFFFFMTALVGVVTGWSYGQHGRGTPYEVSIDRFVQYSEQITVVILVGSGIAGLCLFMFWIFRIYALKKEA